MASKKIMSAGGIGESKNFGVPEDQHIETGIDKMLGCHINGVLISEMNLDSVVLHALDYYATDEGIAEKNARPNVREPSGASVGRDGFDKALEQRRDDVKERDMPMYEARHPLKEVADKYAQPGMKAKFLSRQRVKENGGTGEYAVVKDAAGDPVMVKGMILGHTPIENANARNKHYQERGNQLLKQIGETYKREGGATAVADQ